ncbi:hypothetical protein SCARD494_13647 [Seiridium cardinale]
MDTSQEDSIPENIIVMNNKTYVSQAQFLSQRPGRRPAASQPIANCHLSAGADTTTPSNTISLRPAVNARRRISDLPPVRVIVQIHARHDGSASGGSAARPLLGLPPDTSAVALQVNEQRVERLGEGVDKVEDAVVEVSRCVREVLGGKLADAARGIGTARNVRRAEPSVISRDQDYDTIDAESRRGDGDSRYNYAESMYTVREDEDGDDWENRTVITEPEPRSDTQWDKRRREEKIWSKGDWKGIEVFR